MVLPRLLPRSRTVDRYRNLCYHEPRSLCRGLGGVHEARVPSIEGDLVTLSYAKDDHAHTNSETEQAHAGVMTEQREQPVISIDDVGVYFTKGRKKQGFRELLRNHG